MPRHSFRNRRAEHWLASCVISRGDVLAEAAHTGPGPGSNAASGGNGTAFVLPRSAYLGNLTMKPAKPEKTAGIGARPSPRRVGLGLVGALCIVLVSVVGATNLVL